MKRAQSLLHIIFISIAIITSIESYHGIISIAPECREKLAGFSTAQQDTLMVVYDYDIVSIYKQYPDMYECLSRVQSSYKPGRSLSDNDPYSSFAMPATQPIELFKSKYGILGFLNGVLSFTCNLLSRFTARFGIDFVSFIPYLLKKIEEWGNKNNKIGLEWARITGPLADVYRSWDCETFRKYFDERIYFSEETEDVETLLNTYGLWEFEGFCGFIAGIDSSISCGRPLSVDKMLYPYLKKIMEKMRTHDFHQNMSRAGDLGDIVQRNIPRIYEIIESRLRYWQQLPEQIENERIKNQQQKELQNRIDTMFDAACCSTIRQSLIDACTLFLDDQERIDIRLAALEKREVCDYTTQTYTLLPEVTKLLNRYDIHTTYYTTLTGLPFAHLLHKEALQLLHTVAAATHIGEDFTESLVDLVDTSAQYNRNFNCSAAMKVIDYVRSLVDLIPVQFNAYNSYLKNDSPEPIKFIVDNPIVQGILLGVGGNIGSILHCINHPIESSSKLGTMIAKAGYYLAAIVAEMDCVENGWQEDTPIAESLCNRSMALMDYARKQPLKDKVQFVTTIAADTLLTPWLFKRLATMGHTTVKKCAQVQEILHDAHGAQEVVLAADIPYALAQAEVIAHGEKELALMSKMSQTPHSTPPVTPPAPIPTPPILPTSPSKPLLPAVIETVDPIALKLMTSVDSKNIQLTTKFLDAYNDLVTKIGNAGVDLVGDNVIKYLAKVEAESALLAQILRPLYPKGYGALKQHTIVPKIKHILFLDAKWKDLKNLGPKFSGFHHDHLGILEKSGIVELSVQRMGQFGERFVDIVWCGKTVTGKSLFPSHWTQEEVIKKVFEAFEYCRKNNIPFHILKSGDYKLIGLTSEGLEIEMIITESGIMTSAFLNI